MLDPTRLNRIRWRARRGLLENDIVLEKYFARHADTMSEEEIGGLDALLDLSDNELLDLVMGRVSLSDVPTAQLLPSHIRVNAQSVLATLQQL